MDAEPDRQICGDLNEPDYGLYFECQLLPGHAGDHEGTWYWTNEPFGPKPPPPPPTPQSEWLAEVYDKMLRQQLGLIREGCALLNGEAVARAVINRDLMEV